jgi:DNA segregation ATPase FtsK/SpoIIIE-like protein
MRKSNERLRHQLEVQAIQIEEFLDRHKVQAEVEGGMVRSRSISFDLNTQLAAGIEKLRGLGSELASTLGASEVSITEYDDRLRIDVQQPESHSVDLVDLLDALPENSAMTAVLGLDVEDRPVLLNLMAEDMNNILIAGGPESGKTALLRTFALSIALQNRQSQVQMAILDVPSNNRGRSRKPNLYPLNYLPHVMFTVVESLREAAEALNFLVSEVEYRIEQEVSSPLLGLIIDDVDKLVEIGGMPIIEPLTYLLEEGVNAGLRIILGASSPNKGEIRQLLKHNVPVRLVGKVADSSTARALTGVPDSQAEYLMGQGDFIAVSNGMILPFQAAFLTEYDLHLILDNLHRQNQRVILAQPIEVRPTLNTMNEATEQPQYFEFNSNKRQASLEPPTDQKPDRQNTIVLEADNQAKVRPWTQSNEEIEEAEWEEIDGEEYEDWENEEQEEAVIEIWGGTRDLSADNSDDSDWDDESDENETKLQIWSDSRPISSNGSLSKRDADEIAFDWD